MPHICDGDSKYWTYVEPGDGDQPVYTTLSENEILDFYWDYWSSQMVKAGKDLNNYCPLDCIDDFAVIHWAWRSE